MSKQMMITGVTRVKDSYSEDTGTFQGWDDDGAALILWDGYDDEDSTFAYRVISPARV